MNDFDEEKLDRLSDRALAPYEKVLEEQERRARLKEEAIERRFDWLVRDTLGEFYNYDPRED